MYDFLVSIEIFYFFIFKERDSGWALKNIKVIELNIAKYSPMTASSYIPLPKSISTKKAVTSKIAIRNVSNGPF